VRHCQAITRSSSACPRHELRAKALRRMFCQQRLPPLYKLQIQMYFRLTCSTHTHTLDYL
jgi:hypothetical protein